MAIASSMTILGNMLGPTIGGFVAGEFGITASFVTNSLLLVTLSVLIWKFFEDPPRHTLEGGAVDPRAAS
jgi:MFS family permease